MMKPRDPTDKVWPDAFELAGGRYLIRPTNHGCEGRCENCAWGTAEAIVMTWLATQNLDLPHYVTRGLLHMIADHLAGSEKPCRVEELDESEADE